MIGIYGATGFTGSLIIERLEAKQIPFLLAGRDDNKLQRISQSLVSKPNYIIANVDSPTELQKFCKQCQVIINCAGPFLRWGEPVVAAALEQGCHYLDICAEQPFVKLVYDRYNQLALERGLCVIPGAGFEGAVSDLRLSHYNSEFDKVYCLNVTYIKTGLSLKSIGTRLSTLEMIPVCQGWCYRGSGWELEPLSYRSSVAELDGKFLRLTQYPGVDIIHAPLTLPSLQKVDTYMAGLPPTIIIQAIQLIAKKIPGFINLIQQYIRRGRYGPTEEQRYQRKFTILHEISGEKNGHQITKNYAMTGCDPYGFTAKCIAEMAERLYRGLYTCNGVCSPASTFDAVSFMNKLQSWDLMITPIKLERK